MNLIESIISDMTLKLNQKNDTLENIYTNSMSSIPKYFMYSSHDTQMGIIWDFLAPILDMQEWYYIPYASYLELTLKYDKVCINEILSQSLTTSFDDCFTVHFKTNGRSIFIDNEAQVDFVDFIDLMQDVGVEDSNEACN
jgi:hypothetical protein